MTDAMTVDAIIDSLARRGFYQGADTSRLGAQFSAVVEELGEVARRIRRAEQGQPMDTALLAFEAADTVISAVCLLATIVGRDTGIIIGAKMSADEHRGFLHQGGPLKEVTA